MEQLKTTLELAGIDVAQWGIGQAKTLEHLKKEIESGEACLTIDKSGKLLRKVAIGVADIFHQSSGGKYYLKEDRQVFADGRERRRNLGQSVSEKIKPDEDVGTAMIRGIQDELGISGEIALVEIGTDDRIIDSPSYPGLQSQYALHKFQALLTAEQFNPNGYIEMQPDKTTYFIWEKAE